MALRSAAIQPAPEEGVAAIARQPPEFDVAAAHVHFSSHCFNRAWELIEKTDRTPDDDRLLVALNQASICHRLQRPDCDDRRLAIGFWQAARIHAILGQAAEALRFAEACRARSAGLQPFYAGYAHEALARAHALGGDAAAAAEHRRLGLELAGRATDPDERQLLLADLQAGGG